jgi:hypothetical protein
LLGLVCAIKLCNISHCIGIISIERIKEKGKLAYYLVLDNILEGFEDYLRWGMAI